MIFETDFIDTPESPKLKWLCSRLRELANPTDRDSKSLANDPTNWPAEQLKLISEAGIYRWFVLESQGGLGWSSADIVAGYVELASACLTTTFIITQRVAALRRVGNSKNEALCDRLLPGMLDGSQPATVGISHLTTSRRHVGKPVLQAESSGDGFVVNGFSPWVTGAANAAYVVMGAELADGKQILFAVEASAKGVAVAAGFDLVGLSASQTGSVKCENVVVGLDAILAGPTEQVLLGGSPTGVSTGSFQTSALAIGLAQSAIEFIRAESERRSDLESGLEALDDQHATLKDQLFKLASGVPGCTNEELRIDANSLVLRATQAALVAAKGTGYVKGHAVGRWCQEALFFLVWSCPQAVQNANLCELAGVEGLK